MRTLWDLAKMAVKISLLVALAWYAMHSIPVLASLGAQAEPAAMPGLLKRVFVDVSIWIVTILLVIAAVDLLFSRREYVRKLRMSRRDIKDEVKKREGDPHVKSKRRKLGGELLKRSSSIRRVPDADVVLTNPTHLAIALKYRPRTMLAPVVLAKGTDRVARRMRKLAVRSRVPVLESPKLARALFRECDIDGAVPGQLFEQLAPIYRWLMSREGNRIRT